MTEPTPPSGSPERRSFSWSAGGRMLWPILRTQAHHFLGSLVLLGISSLLMVLGPLLIKRAIDRDIAGRDLESLWRTVLLYLTLQLAQLATLYLMRNWLELGGQNMMAALRKRLLQHVLRLPLSFHDRHPPGQLLTRIESDTQALRMVLTTTGVMLLGDLMLFVGMFVAMAWVSPRLTLVTAVLIPVLLGLAVTFQKRIHPLFVEVRSHSALISGRLTELLQAMPIVRSYQRQRWAAAQIQQLSRNKYEVNLRAQRLVILWFNLVFLLETLAFAAILGLGGWWAVQGLVTIGTLAMFLEYLRRFFEPVLRLSEQLSVVQKAMAAAERIDGLLQEPLRIQDPLHPAQFPEDTTITFDEVWFRYHDHEDWVLKDVSFTVPAGQHWAVVGPTGSGKTTLVSLLYRFYDPQRGRILIGGVDLRDLRQDELRRQLALVAQDIYLFPGNLLDNLTLGEHYSREHVEQMAQQTSADRLIRRLPGGYEATLSERGINLSLGQRQLLSITRALIRQPSLLVLDEATSAIDPATEALVSRATQKLLAGRTALIIAHRLSTIAHCDRVLVMEGGEVVQLGTHRELIASPGLYQELHRIQFAAEPEPRPAAEAPVE